MRSSAVWIAGAVLWSACDAGGSSLDGELFTKLDSDEQRELCDLEQALRKRVMRSVMEISCTDVARDADDCEEARRACLAQLPGLMGDICASQADAARVMELVLKELERSPQFAGVVAELRETPSDLQLDPACKLTVGQYRDCIHSQGADLEHAARVYDCAGGDEALTFPLSAACMEYAQVGAACFPESRQP